MRLKEVTVSANTGLDAIKRAPIVEEETGLKCIRIQDISQEKDFDDWGNTVTTEKDYKKFKLKINDLLVARTGATVGVSYLVKKEYNAVFNNGSIRLRFSNEVNTRFIYYVFKSKSFSQYIDNVSCVATQPNLRVENLLRFNIPDIDKERQDLIVAILEKYDDLIETNSKRIKLLEQMAENLYKEWFVRFRFPGHETAEFEGGIPRGWDIMHVGEIGQVIAGGTPSTDIDEYYNGDVPWLTPADLSSFNGIYISSGSTYITELGLKKSSATMMPKNTVLLSSRAPIGYVALARNEICTNQGFKNVVCDEEIVNYQYLYWYFKMNKATLEAFGSGATFLEISSKGLKKVKVIIPPLDLQKKFAVMANDISEQVYQIERANDNLIKQRDLLLPRLMSGKLEIK